MVLVAKNCFSKFVVKIISTLKNFKKRNILFSINRYYITRYKLTLYYIYSFKTDVTVEFIFCSKHIKDAHIFTEDMSFVKFIKFFKTYIKCNIAINLNLNYLFFTRIFTQK